MRTPFLLDASPVFNELVYQCNLYGISIPFLDTDAIVREEIECYFFGPTYEHCIGSTLRDAISGHFPTDIVNALCQALRSKCQFIVDSVVSPQDREMFHYQVEFIDMHTIYLNQLQSVEPQRSYNGDLTCASSSRI